MQTLAFELNVSITKVLKLRCGRECLILTQMNIVTQWINKLPDCCQRVVVSQSDSEGSRSEAVYDELGDIFQSYTKVEQNVNGKLKDVLVNGKVTYTSDVGKLAIAYNKKIKGWVIQNIQQWEDR